MPEFLVSMDITFPQEMPPEDVRRLLEAERQACLPFMANGSFRRVWRTWGSHEGSHGHLALWDMPDCDGVYAAYSLFPLVKCQLALIQQVQPLQHNPNDPGPAGYAEPLPVLPPLTYTSLRRKLDLLGKQSTAGHGEGLTLTIGDGISIHDHPSSGRPRELHLMADGQKVAEIGPADAAESGEVGPSYVDLLAEWTGQPVRHQALKNRVLADNRLLHPDHGTAASSPRYRRDVP